MNFTQLKFIKLILVAVTCLSPRLGYSSADFDVVVFPWIMEGTSTEFASFHKTELEESLEKLAGSLGTKVSLSEKYKEKENYVRNIEKGLRSFRAVKQKEQQRKGTVLVQPYICKLNNDLLISTLIHRTDKWELQAIAHNVTEDTSSYKSNLEEGIISSLLEKSYEEAASKLKSKDTSNNLKIKITEAKGAKYRLKPKSKCLTLLLNEKLLSKYQIITSIGYEHYSLLKRSKLQPSNAPYRATRQLIIDWYNNSKDSYEFKVWKAESVFGQRIKNKITHQFEMKQENGKYEIANNLDLSSFLEHEKTALNLSEMPQISKVYRAWAYLDKGRAWGLKIGDRLTSISDDGETIKGHIVGFFGPDHGISSPKGYEIAEGAILFVRKGQRHTRVGQKLDWDNRNFPTPWPPKEDM